MKKYQNLFFQKIKDLKSVVVHVALENAPFSKEGGLGDFVGSLPVYLAKRKFANIVFSPSYDKINEELTLIADSYIHFNNINFNYQLLVNERDSVLNIFIRTEEAFSFDRVYLDGLLPYKDEISIKYFIFAKIVVDFLNRYIPDCTVITHDWHVAPIYLYLRSYKKKYRTFHIIHNFHYQGEFFSDATELFEMEIQKDIRHIFHEYNHCSFSAIAAICADQLITVSPTYAFELFEQTAPHPNISVLKNKQIKGILSGIDDRIWNPKVDKYLGKNYDDLTIELKRDNKIELIKRLKMGITCEMPIISVVSRLTIQKGIDLHINLNDPFSEKDIGQIKQMLDLGVSFIINGVPQGGIEGPIDMLFKRINKAFPDRYIYINKYTEELAHQIIAGSDLLLHLSRFEPCGLTPMYALKYGTIPIVTPVGGLKDSVKCYFQEPGSGFGFHIEVAPTFPHFFYRLKEILQIYNNKVEWNELMKRAMRQQNGWEYRITEYIQLLK
ncbi:MAG: hypothetical protein QG657_3722 [Acidobacteriota bacterium]|nr:hypothetical protein [Acidobacteriota bacterium]